MAFIGFAIVTTGNNSKTEGNPLLSDFNTPYLAPPFDRIKNEHYLPAIESAITSAKKEIEAIVNSEEDATFKNTIEALSFAGKKLDEVASVIFNLNYAETNPELQKVVREVAPMLTDFSNDIHLNATLFNRVKSVYENTESIELNPEQQTLLKKTYKGFVRKGANLNEKDKEKYRGLTRELSELSLIFDENVLAETNGFFLHLNKENQLAGLPKSLIDSAALAAQEKKLDGWVITLHMPMFLPFMKFSENRELREKIYKAFNKRGFNGNSYDNTKLIKRIVNLRLNVAKLLGYNTYADYVLEERMAISADKVNGFLEKLLNASLPHAEKELNQVEEYAKTLGVKHKLEKWDWAYYTEKFKDKLFKLKEEELKPYFPLDNVRNGAFTLAQKLYGLKFLRTTKAPLYHPDVETYEVFDGDGSFLALLYLDFFPREGKNGGAWMTSYRDQYKCNGKDVRPIISIVTNFTKPTKNEPSLLTFNEATTFLHEFGHALHGILSDVTYPNLSGTSVYRDFVELPSQIHENWALEKEFLDLFAKHYKTGEPIPQSMVQSIIDSKNYLAGNLSIRQLSFGLVDMAWHSLNEQFNDDVVEFERAHMSRAEVMSPTVGTAFSTAFSHIFAGGYAAGYYSYKWAEVLDADAFSLFKEKGIFDSETAKEFREQILSKGGSEHPMTLYKRFRGQEPKVDALLERSGLKG
ncbi:MAG: M3 family metallopeptidase [Bacteroidales bacterium]